MNEITQDLVKELFTYKNGNLYWKVHIPRSTMKINDKAGSLNKNNGYYKIKINQKLYLGHRLIFLYHHGYLPKYVDHIDGNKQNNNIENLREITKSQNGMNRKSNKNSSSKYKGVSWAKHVNKWLVQIRINNKGINLGYFINEIDAAKTYNIKAIELFGKYAHLNKI